LHDHNIQLLNDTAVLIENSFYLVGREDISISQFTQQKRKELSAIIEDVDKSKPMILLDHQPYKLDQAEKNGIDLQLSGHTHHGQLWPFNFITKAVYELSHGYKQKGTTHYYVSCGIGGWGPPMRTNSRPEIVSIKMHFK
jgi:predicted MPP superfamily phosphohydrolase